MQVLDAVAVRQWADACVRSLDANRDEIDRINVFPVPDGDTGTNLSQTMRSAQDSLLRAPADSVGQALAALARGALAGARGNSGVILSQVLRGLAEAAQGASTAGGQAMRNALRRADELATAAVSRPVPGTVLTVLHAAAEAARDCPSDALDDVVTAAARAGAEALAETPRQLAVLARAGVVDAGGRGLVVLLDSLAAVITGRPVEPAARPSPARTAEALTTARESGSAEYEYEVMYLLDGSPDADALKQRLATLGDCVSVVGDGADLWTVHVHCNDIGAAIEAGVEQGRPHRITVARFADQFAAQAPRFVRDRAVIVLVEGAGAVELFRSEGAVVAAPTADPADLLAVVVSTRARHVTVLPGDPDLRAPLDVVVAQAADAGQDVVVVPTSSPVQALAALAVHDASRRPGDDVVAMAEAAAATRRGELRVSEREAITWVGRCRPGDLLGMLDGEVVAVEPGPADVGALARRLVDRMLAGGGELVTALLGEDAPEGLAQVLEEHLRIAHPEVDLAAYQGGQPGAVLIVGVE
ncbi:DAK2 domain-containing protein [Actinosynnema sp. NPDC047251]|uniref:Dak phosphatase n=1 Tax=Saccharothrix espanaensis (strain ATCC 51144 / DSM 44229 / JCM 9112 / NBRC 15066 / NRRL 15764) TaxID=1179773 RepID=K0KCT7_SACES|nr:DAK2 domain-containing protein [Saccharothrix espanaensis]CCH34403.1 Dak phosphatase [Saccharothrix espanaensis DSM 44229]